MLERLERVVRAGEGIRPWLVLGPVYRDLADALPGLTSFESSISTAGLAELEAAVAQARPLLLSSPREGEEAVLAGEAQRWRLVRRPEEYLSWGEFFYGNHLCAALLSTRVAPRRVGLHGWRLRARINSRAVVALDGLVVFDSGERPVEPVDGTFEYRFQAPLGPWEHVLSVGLFRLARSAQVGARLELLEDEGGELEARVPLRAGMSRESRLALEEEIASVRLDRELFVPGEAVAVRVGLAPREARALTLELLSERGELLRSLRVERAGPAELCRAEEIPDGLYRIDCSWRDAEGRLLDRLSFGEPRSIAYGLYTTTPAPLLAGAEHDGERRRLALEHYADRVGWFPAEPIASGIDRYVLVAIWPEVARYALGRYGEVDEAVIRETCRFVSARKDCSDFLLQGLLRIMFWERRQPRLGASIRELVKETVLGFTYWVDEPGDTVMYMGTENHRLLFHVAEWMAGRLYPLEEFAASRQRGLYHAARARASIAEWLRRRGRFGFDEWHSNCYYAAVIAPLVNVWDFAPREDVELRQAARALLDCMCSVLAADTFGGLFGTAHSRSYAVYLKYPDFETTAAACWVLWGTGSLTINCLGGMGPVTLATSRYRPPPILERMALDRTSVVETHRREGLLETDTPHADIVVYRTPDYLLSSVQDWRKGEPDSSAHVAQLTMPGRCILFWSMPQTSGEGAGLRPDYWSGNVALPRAVQHRNVLALTFRLSGFAWMSHCWLEPERFDELRQEGRWLLLRAGAAYAALWSEHEARFGSWGQYAGRELVCEARETSWLLECGREADWGSFDAFARAISSARVGSSGGVLTYDSPSIGRLVTGWEATPTLDGEPLALHGAALLDSPWGEARFGSGERTLRYGSEEHRIWFNL